MKLKKDRRNKLWAEIELRIQKRAKSKDRSFVLSGPWKRFVREQDGFKVCAVDGEWVRNNLSVLFGHGGHGYVHESIPLDEIWVDTHHYDGCSCKNVKPDRKMSPVFFNRTVVHEITEFKEMEKGKIYWEAHQIALKKETEGEILEDPYREVD